MYTDSSMTDDIGGAGYNSKHIRGALTVGMLRSNFNAHVEALNDAAHVLSHEACQKSCTLIGFHSRITIQEHIITGEATIRLPKV